MFSFQISRTNPRINFTYKVYFSRNFRLQTISTLSYDCAARNSMDIFYKRSSFKTSCLQPASNVLEKCIIELPDGLKPELMPKHISVIMDGNRRWAKNRMLPVEHGYRAWAKAMIDMALNCCKLGVDVLSVFVFSTENWTRPKNETDILMSLTEDVINSKLQELIRNDVQVSFIGDRSRLPHSLQTAMTSVEESTMGNQGMQFMMAVNYGGRYDITNACKKIAKKVSEGILRPEDIDEALLERHLGTTAIKFPNPDIVIRTSGELRISNFLMWQLAYSELCFTNKLFPDFEEADLVEAIRTFQQRNRRYGGKAY